MNRLSGKRVALDIDALQQLCRQSLLCIERHERAMTRPDTGVDTEDQLPRHLVCRSNPDELFMVRPTEAARQIA